MNTTLSQFTLAEEHASDVAGRLNKIIEARETLKKEQAGQLPH